MASLFPFPLSSQSYLSKYEASVYLRCSLRQIEYLLSRGKLKAYRPGKKLLFLRKDLDDFVQRFPANAEPDAPSSPVV